MSQLLPVVRIAFTDLDDPAARALERRHSAEIHARYGGTGDGSGEPPIDAGQFRGPSGAFVVAWLDGEAVGCAGLRRLDQERGELKRLFVRPESRRRGVARVLLEAVEAAAVKAGYRELWLETGTAQPEAMRLYEVSGYAPVVPYGEYKEYPGSRCFARILTPAPGSRSQPESQSQPRSQSQKVRASASQSHHEDLSGFDGGTGARRSG